MNEQMAAVRSIVVERVMPHPPEKIWRALTEAHLIEQWLMANDFEPRLGAEFMFRAKPMGDWDGIVHCEVLQCAPPACAALFLEGWFGFQSGLRIAAQFRSDLDVDAGRGRHARQDGARRFCLPRQPLCL